MRFHVFWSICLSSSLVHFKRVQSISQGRQPRYLSLWWDFNYVVWFRVVSSFSWNTLFKFLFLSSRFLCWCPLQIFPNICKFPFLNMVVLSLVGRVFAYGPGDLGSITGRVIPKTLKMVLDVSFLSTQQYQARIKSKVD